MIQYLFVLLTLAGVLSIFFTSLINGISPMPTSPKVKNRLLEVVPINPPKRIVELGAGWGNLAFSLAKRYPQSTVIAIENSFIPYLVMLARKILFPTINLIIMRKNFYKENLSSYDLIVCYLYPGAMDRLGKKFKKELTPGTSIYTHTFSLLHFEPLEKWRVQDLYKTIIYHYKM